MSGDAAAPGTPAGVLLRTRELTKEFRGLRAVSEVSLGVVEGTVHALVGPAGAGKTTLVNLLTGFLSPTSGQVLFRGEDITGRQPEQIAHLGIARSFRIPSVVDPLSVVDLVELALASPTGLGYPFWRSSSTRRPFRDRAMDLLDQAGLADHSGEAVGSLTHDRKRALELALALGRDPQLLFLDEPTAGTEPEDVDATIALVSKVAEGRTVVLVDHNMHVIGSLADTVTVLRAGRVLVEGSYDEVRHDERVVTTYLGPAGRPC